MSENTQVRQALWDAYFRADTGTLDGARMIADIATLTAENARLREDAARLDWIGRQMDGVHIEAGLAGGEYQMRRFATVYTFTQEFRADNVRAALDTARAQEGE